MKFASFASAALLLGLGATHPVSTDLSKRTEGEGGGVDVNVNINIVNIDVTILQFALTVSYPCIIFPCPSTDETGQLEHLENVFYKAALTRFSEHDFKMAGYGKRYYENLQFVVADEQSHVQLLTTAIQAAGQAPVAPCTYKFPWSDV